MSSIQEEISKLNEDKLSVLENMKPHKEQLRILDTELSGIQKKIREVQKRCGNETKHANHEPDGESYPDEVVVEDGYQTLTFVPLICKDCGHQWEVTE